MSPERDLDLTPSQEDVGMMALLFRQCAYLIHKSEGGAEVGKLEVADDVMLVDDAPLCGIRQHAMKLGKIFPLERRHTPATGNTRAVGKRRVRHGGSERGTGKFT